jgi:hypothetical protein
MPVSPASVDSDSRDAIANALEELRVRLAQMQRQRAELERSIAAAQEEERLLKRVLALRQGAPPANPEVTQPNSDASANTAAGPERTDVADSPTHPLVQAVIRELASTGRPMHISDLMRLLRDADIQIPGAGTQANLITYLRRDPRLVRPSRGMYGLSAWGLDNMPTTTKSKRRKRRVRAASPAERTET